MYPLVSSIIKPTRYNLILVQYVPNIQCVNTNFVLSTHCVSLMLSYQLFLLKFRKMILTSLRTKFGSLFGCLQGLFQLLYDLQLEFLLENSWHWSQTLWHLDVGLLWNRDFPFPGPMLDLMTFWETFWFMMAEFQGLLISTLFLLHELGYISVV